MRKNDGPLFHSPQRKGLDYTKRQLDILDDKIPRPLREFCVSVFRQNQEYYVFNVHDEGLFPLVTSHPEGWGGMRAGTA